MTIDDERINAIKGTRIFLERIMRESPFPFQKKEMRAKAYKLLKHFPEDYWLEDLVRRLKYVK